MKRRLKDPEPEPIPDPFQLSAQAEELMEGETADEWEARQEPIVNESRHDPEWLEHWDPNLGCL